MVSQFLAGIQKESAFWVIIAISGYTKTRLELVKNEEGPVIV